MIYIVAGVAGSGKTTVGKLLAERLNLPFFDADDFHPLANIEKMHSGIPLNDADRQPWLQTLAENIVKWQQQGGAVLACSALKESYRRALMVVPSAAITWILLQVPREEIEKRLHQRTNHFFDADLLKSQFDILEVPAYGLHINAMKSPKEIVEQITAVR